MREKVIILAFTVISILVFNQNVYAIIQYYEGKMCVANDYVVYNMKPDFDSHMLYLVSFDRGYVNKDVISHLDVYPIELVCDDVMLNVLTDEEEIKYLRDDKGKFRFYEKVKRTTSIRKKPVNVFSRQSKKYLLPSIDNKYKYFLEINNPDGPYSEAKIVQYNLNDEPKSQLYLYKAAIAHSIKNFHPESVHNPHKSNKLIQYKSIKPLFGKKYRYNRWDENRDKDLLQIISAIDSISGFIESPSDQSKVPEALYYLGNIKSKTAYMISDARGALEDAVVTEYISRHYSSYKSDGRLLGILYTGDDWERLAREYPNSEYADEVIYNKYSLDWAAYENDTFDPLFDCSITLEKYSGFLKNYPWNSYSNTALSRISSSCNVYETFNISQQSFKHANNPDIVGLNPDKEIVEKTAKSFEKVYENTFATILELIESVDYSNYGPPDNLIEIIKTLEMQFSQRGMIEEYIRTQQLIKRNESIPTEGTGENAKPLVSTGVQTKKTAKPVEIDYRFVRPNEYKDKQNAGFIKRGKGKVITIEGR